MKCGLLSAMALGSGLWRLVLRHALELQTQLQTRPFHARNYQALQVHRQAFAHWFGHGQRGPTFLSLAWPKQLLSVVRIPTDLGS